MLLAVIMQKAARSTTQAVESRFYVQREFITARLKSYVLQFYALDKIIYEGEVKHSQQQQQAAT